MRPACKKAASASWTWPLNSSMWANDDSLDGCSLRKLMYWTRGNWKRWSSRYAKREARNTVSLFTDRFTEVSLNFYFLWFSGGLQHSCLAELANKQCSYLSDSSISHLCSSQLSVCHCHASEACPQRLVLGIKGTTAESIFWWNYIFFFN